MLRSLGPLAFPKSPGAERPLEELAQDAGRLASWSISRFPAGDLGMSGLFLSETEENGGGGRGTVLWRALPFCSSALSPTGTDKAGPEATNALLSSSLHLAAKAPELRLSYNTL